MLYEVVAVDDTAGDAGVAIGAPDDADEGTDERGESAPFAVILVLVSDDTDGDGDDADDDDDGNGGIHGEVSSTVSYISRSRLSNR
jgi:hypothetical protein